MIEIPEYQRRQYQKTNLSRVVFQLHFSPVLTLRQKFSADLQEAWRQIYPVYEEASYSPGENEGDERWREHRLADSQNDWIWLISEDSITLMANDYPGWEPGIRRFEEFTETFWKEYEPAFIHRVGFRYQDVLEQSDADSPHVWKPYIRSELANCFANELTTSGLMYSTQQLLFEHPDGIIRLGVETRSGETQKDQRPAQRLDMDFDMSCDQLEATLGEAIERLDSFHEALVGLFEWTIADGLRDEMSPKDREEK